MKYSQAMLGRTFVLRLEDGDRLPDSIEAFARERCLLRAFCIFLGGIKSGSTIVTGPADDETMPPNPMLFSLVGAHEVAGVGTVFPDQQGIPKLHGHGAFGRSGNSVAGCIRPGIVTWKVVEVIICEMLGQCGTRVLDPATGFELLEPGQ